MKRVFVSALFVLASSPLGIGAAAAEPTKQECVDANDAAQDLRRTGKLNEAREKLLLCTSASCPGLVREDCSQRLDEVERLQPTIVFDAKDAAGHDLTEVKVTIDGRPFAERLDGKALAVNPGQHVFTFDVAGQPAKIQILVVKEGEKARRERVVIGSGDSAPPQTVPIAGVTPSLGPVLAGEPRHDETPSAGKGQRVAGIAVGAAGIVGLGLGAIFGGVASSSWSSAKKECGSPTSCPSYAQGASDHDAATSAATVSTVGFIAGGALIAGGLTLFFTAPSASSTATSVRLVPAVGGMIVRGSF